MLAIVIIVQRWKDYAGSFLIAIYFVMQVALQSVTVPISCQLLDVINAVQKYAKQFNLHELLLMSII